MNRLEVVTNLNNLISLHKEILTKFRVSNKVYGNSSFVYDFLKEKNIIELASASMIHFQYDYTPFVQHMYATNKHLYVRNIICHTYWLEECAVYKKEDRISKQIEDILKFRIKWLRYLKNNFKIRDRKIYSDKKDWSN